MVDQKMQRSRRSESKPNTVGKDVGKSVGNNAGKQAGKAMSKRAQRRQQQEVEREQKRTFWVQIRILPIWLRLILVTLLLVLVVIIGLRIGYSYIGDGNPEDVLKKETWTHIIDIIKGIE